jgi:hypothetical protein
MSNTVTTETIWVPDGADVNALARGWNLHVRIFTVMETTAGGASVAITGPEDDFWEFMDRYNVWLHGRA